MKLKTIFLNAVLCLAMAVPAHAESKTVTLRVSCFIKPMIEMAAADMNSVKANSNLDNRYQMTDDLQVRAGQRVRLYSLTAL